MYSNSSIDIRIRYRVFGSYRWDSCSNSCSGLGASIIEKHFTLDKNLIGPDHRASLDPRELEEMVSGIRNISTALGNGIKIPTPFLNRKIKLQSVRVWVALKNIKIGEYLTDKNIGTRRPGSGLAPSLYWDLLGMKATRNYKKYHEIKFSTLYYLFTK